MLQIYVGHECAIIGYNNVYGSKCFGNDVHSASGNDVHSASANHVRECIPRWCVGEIETKPGWARSG